MKRIVGLSLVALLLLLITDSVQGQKRRYKRPPKGEFKITHYKGGAVHHNNTQASHTFIGASVNFMNYFGDIAPAPKKLSTDLAFTKAGFGVVLGKKFHPRISWRLGYNQGTVEGDDNDTADPTDENSIGRWQRNLHFTNTIREFSLGFEIDLFSNYGGLFSRFPINPYIYVGMAGFTHDPKAIVPENDLLGNPFPNAGDEVSLRQLGTEGQQLGIDSLPSPYKKFQAAIPIGVGVKFRVLGAFDAHIEFGLRQLFFDYLDDVSGTNPDLGSFNDELARALVDRGSEPTSALSGNVRDTDFYNVSQFQGADGVLYNRGPNYEPGGVRGGSKDNDFYVVTSIRIVYFLVQSKTRRGKFR